MLRGEEGPHSAITPRDCLPVPLPPPAWVAAMVKSVVGVLSALQALKHMELYLVRVSRNPSV